MPDYKITCERCGMPLTHTCGEDLEETIYNLFTVEPDEPAEGEDPDTPLFSEAYLYTMLGKETARTVLSTINGLLRELGIDPYQAKMNVYRRQHKEKGEGVR